MLVGVKKKVGYAVCGSPPPVLYILSSFSHSQSTFPHRYSAFSLHHVFAQSHTHFASPHIFMSQAAFSLSFIYCCFFSLISIAAVHHDQFFDEMVIAVNVFILSSYIYHIIRHSFLTPKPFSKSKNTKMEIILIIFLSTSEMKILS